VTDREKLDLLAAQLEIAGSALLTMRKVLRDIQGVPEKPTDDGPKFFGRSAKPSDLASAVLRSSEVPG